MRREHVILVAGAIAVSGLAVYLFVAVNAAPAQAQTQLGSTVVAATAPVVEPDEPEHLVRPATPSVKPTKSAKAEPEVEPEVEPRRKGGRLGLKGMSELRNKALGDPDPDRANPKMDAVMDEANRAYDTGDMDDAKTIALKVLAADPTNVRMLRIAVSASCIDGDNTEAQKHYAQLPNVDREQMKIRCARYGITFTDGSPDTDPQIPARKIR